MNEYQYYTKNARYKVSRSVHLGAQRAAPDRSPETKQTLRSPNSQADEQTDRKCCKCGTVLKDTREYIIIDAINVKGLCNGCFV